MVKNLITCENCKFVFESDRKKGFVEEENALMIG